MSQSENESVDGYITYLHTLIAADRPDGPFPHTHSGWTINRWDKRTRQWQDLHVASGMYRTATAAKAEASQQVTYRDRREACRVIHYTDHQPTDIIIITDQRNPITRWMYRKTDQQAQKVPHLPYLRFMPPRPERHLP